MFIGVAAHNLQAIGTERYFITRNVSKTPFHRQRGIDDARASEQTYFRAERGR
jgi:hypothetical protein